MKKLLFLTSLVRLLCFITVATTVMTSCRDFTRNDSHPEITDQSIKKGRKLAAIHCSSCHLLPEPGMIDSKNWEKQVLPHMGPLMGIFEYRFQRYPFNTGRNIPNNYFPAKPVVTQEEWKNILDYYIATSPDSLPGQNRPEPLHSGQEQFSVVVPALNYPNPATSFLKINSPGRYGQSLLTADMFRQTIFRFNARLNLVDTLFSAGAIADMDFRGDTMVSCNIGIFDPTNEKYGDARIIRFDSSGRMKKDSLALFNRLTRPVQMTPADLNQDGKTDYLVCEFGYLNGALSWEENRGNGRFEHHIIRNIPGAVRAYVQDSNNDGLPDIWVLFAQGDEGIFLFKNKGKGRFEQETVLRFPSMFGSSSFELADFNKDGAPDILYTAGDNADYSTVLKPYHGVYIYINDGANHFQQQYFYPINGCYKALARDFDNDGDLDLATIAFFADYVRQPEEGFIYFENKGKLAFTPFTIPGTETGRWITMEAGDINKDGSIDLVLGNFSTAPSFLKGNSDWKKGPPFLLLQNRRTK